MKYIISRTSASGVQPCEEAEKIDINNLRDIRYFKDKEEWLRKFPLDANKVIEWGITPEGDPFRVIEINRSFWIIDIDDLTKLVKKYGKIILKMPDISLIGYEELMQIEIYDDYRE